MGLFPPHRISGAAGFCLLLQGHKSLPLLGEVDRRSLAGGVKRRLSTPQSKIKDF